MKSLFALELKNIKKSFTQGELVVDAVKNATIAIKSGEVVALTGPSGSGKTTLLQIAGLLDSPCSGDVFVNGQNLSNASDKIRTQARKKSIGFVYQFHHLMPEFSVVENVALPLLISGYSKSDAIKEATVIVCAVGLSHRINYKTSELSGGEQQRVGIARAIVAKPALILADEPTGNLDSSLSDSVFDMIINLVRQNGIGCLVVTHNPEIAKRSDRILSIKDGVVS